MTQWQEYLEAEFKKRDVDIRQLPVLERITLPAKLREERTNSTNLPSRTRKIESFDKDQLTRRVWSEPVSIVAKDLGISDKGLAKRCRSLGVPLPPRGFWQKVAVDKEPHPKGVPADLDRDS